MQHRNAERLARFIRSHGCPCRVSADGLTIRAAVSFSGTRGFGWQVETVSADLESVRTWLGY